MNMKWIGMLLIGLFTFTESFGAELHEPLEDIAKTQGFFFFYSASCPHCQRFSPILKRFSQRYGFSVVAISEDGGFLPAFPDAVMDAGLKNVFNVAVFPSLFLVNPKTQSAYLVTEGNIDEALLVERVLKISQLQKNKESSA